MAVVIAEGGRYSCLGRSGSWTDTRFVEEAAEAVGEVMLAVEGEGDGLAVVLAVVGREAEFEDWDLRKTGRIDMMVDGLMGGLSRVVSARPQSQC